MHTWSAPACEVLLDARPDRLLVPDGDDRVDQAVAPAVAQVVVREPHAAHAVRVVRQLQVVGDVLARALAAPRGIAVQHDAQLRSQHGVGPEDLARAERVLGGHEIRVPTGGAVTGEGDHLRAERGEQPGAVRHGRGRRVERVEVLAHRRVRPRVLLDERRVARAEAQDEAPGLPARVALAGDLLGVLHPDVEDARRDRHRPRRVQQDVDGAEDVAPGVRDPQRAPAVLLELGRGVGDRRPVGVEAQLTGPETRCRRPTGTGSSA